MFFSNIARIKFASNLSQLFPLIVATQFAGSDFSGLLPFQMEWQHKNPTLILFSEQFYSGMNLKYFKLIPE